MTFRRSILAALAFALFGLAQLGIAANASADSLSGLPTFKAFSAWSAPVNLGPPVNTQYEESAAAMSADGLTLYFNRNFNGLNPAQPGKVDEDVYVAQRTSRHAPWGDPVALDAINTTSHERNATVSRDGRLLFLSSNRQPSVGGLDLYVSHRITELPIAPNGWSAPVSLGAAINSTVDDIGPGYFQNSDGTSNEARTAIRSDGLEVVFQTNRPGTVGGGLADLWVSTRPTCSTPGASRPPWDRSTARATTANPPSPMTARCCCSRRSGPASMTSGSANATAQRDRTRP